MDNNNESIFKKNLAIRIKEIRENKNISQLKFFNETNIHIGRIEMGNTNITIETLSCICDYLDISITELLQNIDQN